MQPPFDIPADLDTPVSAYLKLAPLGPRFLLESAAGGEGEARYSFLGFGACGEVRLERGGLLWDGRRIADAPTTRAELLALLRDLLARAPRLSPTVPELSLRGGLVGVTGYPIARRLARRKGAAPANVSSDPRGADEPGEPELAYLVPASILVFDHAARRMALLHAEGGGEREALRREVLDLLRGPLPSVRRGGSLGDPRPSLPRDAYVAGVERAREAIYEGEVYQLVLSSRFEGEHALAPLSVYRALRLLNPSPYMFLFEFSGFSVVGASPEALVRLRGRRASLQPIAGTRPRGGTPERDRALEAELLADPKESAEHAMLVDLARNDLGRVAVPGTISVSPYREVQRYSHVMHIVSGVEGALEAPHDQFDLFAAAFPAGTVVGAPKIRAMELIDELEPVGRGIYAGTGGFFGHDGFMDQAIAIRTLVLRETSYAYQAGAGIVADSVPEREHEEVLAKGGALRAALALATEGLG